MENTVKELCDRKSSKLSINLNVFFVFIFILFSIITPADTFKIKKISFFILFLLNFQLIIRQSKRRKYSIIGFHLFIYSSILTIFSILMGMNIISTISNIYLCLLVSVVLISIERDIDFERYLINILMLISLLIITTVILDRFNVLDLYNNKVMMFLHNKSEAMVGKSSSFWSYYVIFLKASPILIILLGYFLYMGKYVAAILPLMALVFTGTRANFFAGFILITIHIFRIQKNLILRLLFIFFTIIFILVFFEKINYFFTNMSALKSGSKIDKMEDLREIFSVFRSHPLTIFLGTGFGSDEIYGITHGTAEISFFDMWRKNGLIGLLIFIQFVLFPLKSLWERQETKWVASSYIVYLMVAMTNPLFFSSTAYIVYIYVYIKYYENKYCY